MLVVWTDKACVQVLYYNCLYKVVFVSQIKENARYSRKGTDIIK